MSDFKNLIYNRLSRKPHPLFIFNDTVIPAATIWVGVKAWSNYFRELGLGEGDRVILCYPESPAFVHVLFAAIWEKLTLCIIRPDNWNQALVEDLDVKLVITSKESAYKTCPDTMGMPESKIELRKTNREKYSEVRFILQSSGSTGNPKFICLTEKGILSVIHTHSKVFESNDTVTLSILPWSHAFGLVLDLLLSTFYADCIVRDPENGKNLDSLFSNVEKYKVTHLSSVPLVLERILQKPNGKDFLDSLESGIVGGAPISSMLAENLKDSKLCIGYGQTEASPGICLGDKGKFFPNYLGKPLGCEINISPESELLFRGENSFYGYWTLDSIKNFSENAWIPTGDLVEEKSEGFFFLGRKDFSFKLPNGIMIQPEQIEENLKLQIPSVKNAFIFYSDQIYLIVSSYSANEEERLIHDIRKFIHPLLKNLTINIKFLSESEWIFSPKGGIDRKKMLEKLK